MEPARNELDEPLGQERPSGDASKHRRPRGAIFLAICAVAVLGVSGTVLLWDRFFPASPSVVSKPAAELPADPASKAEKEEALAQSLTPAVPEAAIVHIDPEASPAASRNIIVVRDPSTIGQNPRIAHLPDRALIEQAEAGPLPVRGADGLRPFDAYARPWSGAKGARIAIVIGGLGISQTGTNEAIEKLPPEITLGFAPLGNSLMRWMQTARREGHEIVMQVPLEPFGYPASNLGRHTLLTGAAPEETTRNLHWVLSRITNYTGVMNHMGARFTADRSAMNPFMEELGRRGLLYFDDGTSARSLAEELALAKGVPFASADEVIDQDRDRGAILEKLDELERIARARGFAVGAGSALETTVDAVSSWAGEVRKRGIELVPLSAVAVDPERG
ncbi:divergent polysaccharide deacetylase family protein [Chelativorans sp. AA-79]|uniref:divergent polysaccharide deacetylase family protein n=1 Tax=Chelativorans sp. AA-79 TaxID=3028735 RepID=UPI0023F8CB99|nr:divergent polysaccharide deacetylase family protein [Chelativorans sp. AA-79]WEX09780.1 divergent polysaccharide deacetylase family protein [Chelativorans sp. AA-79]